MSDYRYERKFFVENIALSTVEMLVKNNPHMFSEIYHSRYINNIYYDTPSLNNYYNNVDGNFNRHKVRIRWYNGLTGEKIKSNLEIKIKKGDLGKKLFYRIKKFSIDQGQQIIDPEKNLLETEIVHQLRINSIRPTLINRFKRKYFQSYNKMFRITIDTDLSFYGIDNNSFSMIRKYHDDTSVIVELKYSPDCDIYARKVSNYFPFRLTKSSKYVIGIENLTL